MDGKTHLGIGLAVGAACALYYSPSQELIHIIEYMGVAGISALAADLDGPSILTRKISKFAHAIYRYSLIAGIISTTLLVYIWFTLHHISPLHLILSSILILLGIISSKGSIRNLIVSSFGIYLFFYGLAQDYIWLITLSVFLIVVPWFKHRGLSHTIWFIPVWGYIGSDLESYLHTPGLGMTASLAYASHLIADMLTPSGVGLLFPIIKHKFKI